MHTIPGYEWDPKKAAANFHKHGVDFADAATAFSDESALKIADHISSVDEDRFVILGMSAPGDVLVVVYAWRGERIRIISARKANPRERTLYGG